MTTIIGFISIFSTAMISVGAPKIDSVLKPIRARYGLPAMAAAVVLDGKIIALGAVGVRKHGDPTPVTDNDEFHLGSDTKAMTAVLIASLIEQGKVRWDSTLLEVFPELREPLGKTWKDVTVEQILAHRGGFSGETAPMKRTLAEIHRLPGDPLNQRLL